MGGEPRRDRFGELLVARGHVTEGQLEEAFARQSERGIPLGQILIEMGVLTRLQLAGLLTEQWASPDPAGPRVPAAPPATPEPVLRVPSGDGALPPGDSAPAARLDELAARLDRLEVSVERLAALQEEAASRQTVEDLRLALRELWKVQKSLLERESGPPGNAAA
jgi:hypothetical protein